jgi:hypothetical protein
MKHNKTIKLLTLISGAIMFVSCSNNQPTNPFIEVGFNEYHGSSCPTVQVGLAFKGEKEQALDATFNVYLGARKGFAEDWQNDLWGCNPGYGKFAINRVIEDEAGNEVKSDFLILDDFPNDEKYPLIYEPIEGTVDGVILHYEGFIVSNFDFTAIDIIKGSIGYYILYYDDIDQKPFVGSYYLYGISWGGKVNFTKNDEGVSFSK